MKVRILVSIFLMISFQFSFSSDIKISEGKTYFSVTNKSIGEFSFINSISNLSAILVKNDFDNYLQLTIPSYGSNAKDGDAELPVLQKLIRVPSGSQIVVEILNKEEKIINLSDFGYNVDIFPNQPSISKSDNADDVPFYYNEQYYSQNKFISNNIITTELLGKMRGQQLARLSVSPISYNPTTNQLKIVTRLEVKVVFKDINVGADVYNRKKYYSSEFETLFKRCVNYIPISHKDVITTYPVKYVIISDPLFQTVLQPFIEWKKKKGFLVVEGYTNNPLIGNTTSSIHAFLKDMYDNASPIDPAPTYLLIVGDLSEVPSFNGNGHVSDMYYCEFDGNGDFYPEMYYGRFSGTTTEQIERQVNKTLNYEKYLLPDFSYLDEVVLVAGVDASMAPVHGNGQINYGTDNYFNIAHNLTVHNYLYGSGTPITSDMAAASAAIIGNISNGVGFANYTAHCGSSGWSDPSFEVSDVSGLQNYEEYGFMIGNCCQSAKFDDPVCFGESLLRAENKGAVGYIGGSNNTYWDEDYWWSVGNTSNIIANPTYTGTGLAMYDCWLHENGEAQADWFFTQGQMIHSGNLAVTQAGGAEQYYWEIYHLMGDPSVMPYLGVPPLLSVTHAGSTPIGSASFSVTTEENAYVALSMNSVLLDAQLAGPTGVVNLSFSPLSNVGNADIVVTKQFRQPYISTVAVGPSNVPFISYNSHTINDPTGNNDFLVDYNELIELDVELINLGSQSAQNVDIIISTNDQYVTLIDSTDFLATIDSNNTINITSPFVFQVSNYVPDQHIVLFTLLITDNQGNSWNSNLSLTINAPILEDIGMTIDDANFGNGNGVLDAGETVDIIIGIKNSGHSAIDSLNAFLSTSSSYITLNSANMGVSLLNTNQQQNTTFNISIDPSAPYATPVEFVFDFSDGTYSHTNIFSSTIGIIDENYETGDFTKYAWIMDSLCPWIISTNNPYEGVNCSRSGLNQPDNTDSELSIDVNVVSAGDISFFKKVSSEDGYDFLKFKINGQKVGEWSGEINWSFESFPVNAGQTIFKWEYDKDWSNSAGQDCAFIDYIVFPPIYLESNSIEDVLNNISLFPNPTMGSFIVEFTDNTHHIVEIYDMHGKLLDVKESLDRNIIFDVSQRNSGVYTIKVMPENITYQIIKN